MTQFKKKINLFRPFILNACNQIKGTKYSHFLKTELKIL